ncbi:TraB/GumN family protein [Brevibacillus ginsengisoli]|uniref:TraB/GumN family protein n=1 Tax=Brevibacillus ginsengisoli TaxID=363854 RepID=UPI003CEFFEA7
MMFSKWGRLKRGLASGLLGIMTLLGSILPVQANEAPIKAPQISQWSIQTLHEGEKYGIYPMSWYKGDDFQKQITVDKLKSLLEATSTKLDAIGLSKTGTFSLPADTTELTREAVLKSLYGVLAQYKLPEAFEIDKYDPINFLQKKKIVNGTASGLDLDQPCTVEQAVVLASRLVDYTYDTAGAGAKGFFWKVTNGGNTLYLLGSIHLGNSLMYPMKKNIKDAFNASDSLWVEANLLSKDKTELEYFTKLTTYNDGTTLKNHISQETYEKLQKVTDKLGIPKGAFDPYKPWVVSNNLSMSSLMEESEDLTQAANMGVDLYFIQKAMLNEKPVQELEGVKFQGDLLNSVPATEQEKELNQALDSVLNPSTVKNEGADAFKQWQQLWAKGDVSTFSQSFSANQQFVQSETAKRLLGERDKNMADKLAKLLEKEGSSTSFVVVGAAHFVVKDMTLDQLKKKGFHVEIIQ